VTLFPSGKYKDVPLNRVPDQVLRLHSRAGDNVQLACEELARRRSLDITVDEYGVIRRVDDPLD
jgi:hypothetical protein